MGYESRLYVVEKSSCVGLDEDGKRYGEIIAMIDMCKLGNGFCKVLNEYPATDCYIYIDGERTVEDKYGDPLVEMPLEDVIAIFEECSQEENYRRYAPAIGLLGGFNPNEWGELVVLHYGY